MTNLHRILSAVLFLGALSGCSENLAPVSPNTGDVDTKFIFEPTNQELNGNVTGYEIRNRDGWINFGLVMPALSKADLFNFQLSSMLSPKDDVLRVAGRSVEVPSNVSIPRQAERYSIITVRLNKPRYTLPVSSNRFPSHLGVLNGRFPLDDVIDEFQAGGSLAGVLDEFQYSGYKIAKTSGTSALDFDVSDSNINGRQGFELRTSVPRGYVALAIALSRNNIGDGSIYFPTDIKTLRPNRPKNLVATNGVTGAVVMFPEEALDSVRESLDKPFPFSLVWGDFKPNTLMPLLNNKVTARGKNINIQLDSINDDFNVLGYEVQVFAKSGENFRVVENKAAFGQLPSSINLSRSLLPSDKLRVDVFAQDRSGNGRARNKSRMVQLSKFMSRYEIEVR